MPNVAKLNKTVLAVALAGVIVGMFVVYAFTMANA